MRSRHFATSLDNDVLDLTALLCGANVTIESLRAFIRFLYCDNAADLEDESIKELCARFEVHRNWKEDMEG